jgi:F-type H+-transporting ATPase subunit a
MAMDALEHVLDHTWFEIPGVGPVTKHQVLLVAAAVAVAVPFILLARRVKDGTPPRGALWNFLEMLLLFIRDEVARPNIGGGHDHPRDEPHGITAAVSEEIHGTPPRAATRHPADRYVPFLWTLFLFILACNLFGMVPFLGSPTAELSVTLVLAALVFLVIHVGSIAKNGVGGWVKSFIPSLQADNVPMQIFLTVLIVPLIALIEVLGAFIRAAVLAVRLFANIFAGHVALGVILLFAVADVDRGGFSPGGTVAAVLMGTALSVLELFVAFLQAFVFVLLSSIFIGLQLNPEH